MAGNIRFHNKFHAYTHYTDPVPGLPGSAMDPIASKEAPFLGNMYVAGCLSARGWLDDDGICRKFLFDAEPTICRPAVICGDHMEGALHYSHTTYSDLSTFDPLRLEIDFNQDTFKTINCTTNEYHIMPVSLSAGCVTSTRFVNPSANGEVNLAFHPHMQWLCARPCILSGGDEAILSMTAFDHTLSGVTCVWKTREHDLEKPLIDFSPTITYNHSYVKYSIDSCAPVLYKFILEDVADVVRLDINGESILICDDSNDLVWDEGTMKEVLSTFPHAGDIPTIYELYHTFPSRRGGKRVDEFSSRCQLLSKSKIIPFNSVFSSSYNSCPVDIKYVAKGSIYFNVAVQGADITGVAPPKNKHDLGNIVVGESRLLGVNGTYSHNLTYYDDGYVGPASMKRTVIDNRIFTKLVQPHDGHYNPSLDKYYTIERHEVGPRSFWMVKSPTGEAIYKNFHTNYNSYQNYPLQNAWQPMASYATGSIIRTFPVKIRGDTYDGVSYTPGALYYTTDEYIRLDMTGAYYGECFIDWSGYYVHGTTGVQAYIVPEDTAMNDDSELAHSTVVPNNSVAGIISPAVVLDPAGYTANTASPSRYVKDQLVRLYTKPGDPEMLSQYTNTDKGPKSTSSTYFSAGGTYRVADKRIINIPNGTATFAISLTCVN